MRAFLNIRRGRKPYSHRPQPAIISLARVYHYEGVGKTDTGQDVLFGQTGIIIFYNFIWCNSIAQKFQNQMNRDSSALDNRFSKTYFRTSDDPIRYFNQSRSPQPKVYRLLGDLIIPFTFRQLYYNSKRGLPLIYCSYKRQAPKPTSAAK